PLWFDPGEVAGQITPFWVLYAIHDALVKPMPGNLMTPSLAETWSQSPDGRAYEFKLREGLKFHNGDPFTAEDVKFSFLRTKGAALLLQKVKEVVIVDPHRVRFVLHEPWPDFMTYYGTFATGAGWIVPKAYMEKVVPKGLEYALPLEPHPYDPKRAKQLLAEAGYPNGFDGGDLYPWPPYFSTGEAITDYLGAVGIKTRVRTMERAALYAALASKK